MPDAMPKNACQNKNFSLMESLDDLIYKDIY